MSDELLNQEHLRTPEREAPLYEKVVFGHEAAKVDIDQMIAYQIMRMGQLVDTLTPVEATRSVNETDATNDAVVVLEGVGSKYETNNASSGNFVNNPKTDEPAAWMLAQQLRGQINKRVDRAAQKQIAELAAWIRKKEAPQAVSTKQVEQADTKDRVAIPGELDSLDDILYGIKLQYPRPEQLQEMLQAQSMAIDTLFDKARQQAAAIPGGEGRKLQSIYARQIEINQEKKAEDARNLMARATRPLAETDRRELNPETFQIVQTGDGKNIIFFDTSGTGTDQGALAVVSQVAHNYGGLRPEEMHMVVLFNQETDAEGTPYGTKVVVQVPQEAREHAIFADDLRLALASRLNIAEAQFGKGFTIATEAGFGGHPGIIGSSQEATALTPEQVKAALTDYADVPRYTESHFTVEAAQIANLAGSGGRFTTEMPPPTTPYDIAERKMNITVPSEDGTDDRVISITEADLVIYKAILKTDGSAESIAFNQRILRQKTLLTEPSQAADLRREKATQDILHAVERNDAEACLRVLSKLSIKNVREMSPATLIYAYNQIAHNPDAIRHIYDTKDRRFRFTQGSLPEGVDESSETYLKALYKFESVHTLVDRDMIDQIRRFASKQTGEAGMQFQAKVGEIMLDMITSDAYKDAHREGPVHDRMLRNALSFCIDPRMNQEVRTQTMARLVREYGSDMKNHWNALVKSGDPALIVAYKQFPGELGSLLSDAGIADMFDLIPNMPDSFVGPPTIDAAAVQARIAQQRQEQAGAGAPVLNFAVQIGERDTAQSLRDSGIVRENGTAVSGEIDVFDSTIITTGQLEMDNLGKHHVHLARAVVEQIVQLSATIQDQPDVKIRLIRGNFPGKVSSEITRAISLSPRLANVRNRVVWCDFNGKTFEESPFDIAEYD